MQIFWTIYKNLEKELIDLSNNIHFCDTQEQVYSIHISDLLIRTSVEIEAISKELYKSAGGNMTPVDNEGKERDLFFDTDCIQFLDINWGITKKYVHLVSPNFYFSKAENKTLRPLKDCNKRGCGRWKKAYQAVKHNRLESITAGNIGNLIRAMASLYLLNLYYRDDYYEIGTVLNTIPFDTRMGSDVFSVSLAHAEKFDYSKCLTEENDAKGLRHEYETSTLLQKYSDDTFELLRDSLKNYNDEAKQRLLESPEVIQFFKDNPEYEIKSLLSFANDAGGEKLVNRILKDQNIINDVCKAKMIVVLNKGQQIYPTIH